MAQLLVRNIDDEVKRRLKQRAAARGHSLEEEVRQILREATLGQPKPESGLGTRISARFRGIGLKPGEELPTLPRQEARIPRFE